MEERRRQSNNWWVEWASRETCNKKAQSARKGRHSHAENDCTKGGRTTRSMHMRTKDRGAHTSRSAPQLLSLGPSQRIAQVSPTMFVGVASGGLWDPFLPRTWSYWSPALSQPHVPGGQPVRLSCCPPCGGAESISPFLLAFLQALLLLQVSAPRLTPSPVVEFSA